MKVLGISASPRRMGNSEILLDKVLEGASHKGARTEKIILSELSISPCLHCESCYESARCRIDDDMRPLYKKLSGADGIVIASPVYFGSVTAQLKAMIDRCQPLWANKFLLSRKKPIRHRRKRPGIFICVSSFNRRRFFANSKEIISTLFLVLGVKLSREIYASDVEYKGEILKRKHLLKKAFRYGEELFHLAGSR